MLRIVKEDAKPKESLEIELEFKKSHEMCIFYQITDTIPVNTNRSAQEAKDLLGLTDEDWDDIYKSYENYKLPIEKHNLWERDVQLIRHALLFYYKPKIQTIMPFSQFSHELLQLVPLKGMSIEDIKKLAGEK